MNTWNKYWLSDGSAHHLSLMRIGFYVSLLIRYLPYPVPPGSAFYVLPENLQNWNWWSYIALYIPPHQLPNLRTLWLLALFLAAIGLFPKVSKALSFALTWLFVGYQANYDPLACTVNASWALFALIFCFADSEKSYSLSTWLKTKTLVSQETGGHFFWPIRLGQVIFVWLFFSVVINRYQYNGLDMLGLQWIQQAFYHFAIFQFDDLTLQKKVLSWVLQNDLLMQSIGLLINIFEFSTIFLLFYKRPKYLILGFLFLMQSLIWYLLATPVLLQMWHLYLYWLIPDDKKKELGCTSVKSRLLPNTLIILTLALSLTSQFYPKTVLWPFITYRLVVFKNHPLNCANPINKNKNVSVLRVVADNKRLNFNFETGFPRVSDWYFFCQFYQGKESYPQTETIELMLQVAIDQLNLNRKFGEPVPQEGSYIQIKREEYSYRDFKNENFLPISTEILGEKLIFYSN